MIRLSQITFYAKNVAVPAGKCKVISSDSQRYNVSLHRCFQTSTVNRAGTFWEFNRRGGAKYEPEDTESNFEHFNRGRKMIIPETKKLLKEYRDAFSIDNTAQWFPVDGVPYKFFEFKGPDSLDDWLVSTDADYEGGSSTANVTITPSGTGLFSGNLSTLIPKTGTVHRLGYANLKFVPPTRSFERKKHYEFMAYTHLYLRVRGDGRNYMVNLHPDFLFDTSWLNLHSYVLHTRGGPYWQETQIPFTKFFLHNRGTVQDKQEEIDLTKILTMSISLMDQNNGPFSLEIDYVGCIKNENHVDASFVYETYRVPRFAYL